jgi:hypothetical protein
MEPEEERQERKAPSDICSLPGRANPTSDLVPYGQNFFLLFFLEERKELDTKA